MKKLPIQYIIVVLIIMVVTWLFGCKTAEPFDGEVQGYEIVGDVGGQRGESSFIGGFGDSTYNPQDTIPTAIDSLIAQLKDIYAVPADMSNYRYLDTVECLMLVCDTAKRPSGHAWLDSSGIAEFIYSNNPEVWWKPGFIIIERFAAWAKFSWLFTPAPPVFLDRRKKLLQPNIIVWMIKELNQ
jgi:hypothetical protein